MAAGPSTPRSVKPAASAHADGLAQVVHGDGVARVARRRGDLRQGPAVPDESPREAVRIEAGADDQAAGVHVEGRALRIAVILDVLPALHGIHEKALLVAVH